jgi:hypothetical protein
LDDEWLGIIQAFLSHVRKKITRRTKGTVVSNNAAFVVVSWTVHLMDSGNVAGLSVDGKPRPWRQANHKADWKSKIHLSCCVSVVETG